MKISDIIKQDACHLSFEVFPPKKSAGLDSVRSATEEIAKLGPAFVSVTYGAGGGTSDFTLNIAKNIRERPACRCWRTSPASVPAGRPWRTTSSR